MALLDFSKIQGVLKSVDIRTLTGIFKFYSENRELIDGTIGVLLSLTQRNKGEKGTKPKPVLPETDNLPADLPTEPASEVNEDQVYYTLKAKALFIEDDRKGGNSGIILDRRTFEQILSPNGPAALMPNQRIHFDISPYDRTGREIGPDDPRHPGIRGTKNDNQYTMDFEWTYDGKVQTNSQDEEDRFELQSSWDDYGMTPVLKLDSPSAGRKRCTFKAWIKPEYNGGERVESNLVVFYCD